MSHITSHLFQDGGYRNQFSRGRGRGYSPGYGQSSRRGGFSRGNQNQENIDDSINENENRNNGSGYRSGGNRGGYTRGGRQGGSGDRGTYRGPSFNKSITTPAYILVISDAEHNLRVPVIIGTNVINRCKANTTSSELPQEWQTAFDCLCDEEIPVRTINNSAIPIAPNEVKTIYVIARKTSEFDTDLTQHVDTSLSGDLAICPRVVSVKSTGNTVRVPVRVCNLSAVIDTWTPDPSKKLESDRSKDIPLEELAVSTDTDNLSAKQLLKVRNGLFHIM